MIYTQTIKKIDIKIIKKKKYNPVKDPSYLWHWILLYFNQ